MNERSKQLGSAVDALLAIHLDWEQETQPMRPEFSEAIDDTIAAFADGDLPADCRDLAAVVLGMEETWEHYKEDAAMQDDEMFLPPNSFWQAMSKLRAIRSKPAASKRYNLEPIKTLIEQKVSPGQICRMYGFVDDSGNEQLWMLEEEQKNPGTHTDRSKGWMPPQERRDLERQRKSDAALERLNKRMAARAKTAERKSKPAPESLRELVLGGTSAEQIALMKRMTVDEVYDQCEREGLDPPPLNYSESLAQAEIKPEKEERIASLTAGRNRMENPPNEAADDADAAADEGTDVSDAEVDELIINMIDEGATDRAIKERIQEQYGRKIYGNRIARMRATAEAAS